MWYSWNVINSVERSSLIVVKTLGLGSAESSEHCHLVVRQGHSTPWTPTQQHSWRWRQESFRESAVVWVGHQTGPILPDSSSSGAGWTLYQRARAVAACVGFIVSRGLICFASFLSRWLSALGELAGEVLANQPASRQWPWAEARNICSHAPLYFGKCDILVVCICFWGWMNSSLCQLLPPSISDVQGQFGTLLWHLVHWLLRLSSKQCWVGMLSKSQNECKGWCRFVGFTSTILMS